ncbi:MAG: type II toxin-antitoxin system death-on-curing family toxin [ANME-2 cluster archaeon]|nr:type II toxin-antitoxin system death-on-curing family toxin [ANME-2 cluster archaeon]
MSELTATKIIEVHNEVIDTYGGTGGILHVGSIEYLIYLIQKENDVIFKASLVLQNIITSHPFMDGNKRTGFQVADLLLRQDGIHIHANDEEILHVLVKIAEYTCSVEKIEKWLREKVRPLHSC